MKKKLKNISTSVLGLLCIGTIFSAPAIKTHATMETTSCTIVETKKKIRWQSDQGVTPRKHVYTLSDGRKLQNTWAITAGKFSNRTVHNAVKNRDNTQEYLCTTTGFGIWPHHKNIVKFEPKP